MGCRWYLSKASPKKNKKIVVDKAGSTLTIYSLKISTGTIKDKKDTGLLRFQSAHKNQLAVLIQEKSFSPSKSTGLVESSSLNDKNIIFNYSVKRINQYWSKVFLFICLLKSIRSALIFSLTLRWGLLGYFLGLASRDSRSFSIWLNLSIMNCRRLFLTLSKVFLKYEVLLCFSLCDWSFSKVS